MISDDKGFTWAGCDYCGFTMGVGFGCGLNEAKTAFKRWGWKYENGKIMCRYCMEDERSA